MMSLAHSLQGKSATYICHKNCSALDRPQLLVPHTQAHHRASFHVCRVLVQNGVHFSMANVLRVKQKSKLALFNPNDLPSLFLTGYFVSSGKFVSLSRAQGSSSSPQPFGNPLYPIPTIFRSGFTMLSLMQANRASHQS